MAHIIAIANQKGGVGKTTTAVNLAASLAIAERRTLLLDADPQGNATSGLGIAKHELEISLYDALVDGRAAREVVMPVSGLPHLAALPATQDLVGAELQLVERVGRESALRKVLDQIEGDYEYVIIDCPPSLGLLTLNVLAAANAVLIPIQCEYYGLEGISQLLNTVRLVQQNFNPGLAISGVLLTMYDARLNLCRQVADDAKEYFGAKMFLTAIPRNVRLAEAPSFGKPILLYDVQSVGAKSYIAVAQELMRRVENADTDHDGRPGANAVADPVVARSDAARSENPEGMRSEESEAVQSEQPKSPSAVSRDSEEHGDEHDADTAPNAKTSRADAAEEARSRVEASNVDAGSREAGNREGGDHEAGNHEAGDHEAPRHAAATAQSREGETSLAGFPNADVQGMISQDVSSHGVTSQGMSSQDVSSQGAGTAPAGETDTLDREDRAGEPVAVESRHSDTGSGQVDGSEPPRPEPQPEVAR